ncbi:MAG: SdpI family protein [Lachnospiraceae bacterium]|nr:SdpI family protein [uncultured Acetatifactor sp.]MCI8543521.1 SdpI family protein [Lachnospiraceae bacterium]
MGFWIFMMCMNLLIPLLMIVFGVVFLRWPPRKINGLFGYRTARSMASQAAWNFAHAYMGRLWLRVGTVMLVLSVPAMLPCLGKGDSMVGLWGGIVSLVECIIMILPIIPTERALKRRF